MLLLYAPRDYSRDLRGIIMRGYFATVLSM
jgi:hypothetical protein